MSENLEPLYISTGQPIDRKFFFKKKNFLMQIYIKILLLFLIVFTGCSSKKFPLVSDTELKETIVGSLVTRPYRYGKEQWYFHENGNIYTPRTRDYPYKHLEGKYYIKDGLLVTIGPKNKSTDQFIEPNSEGQIFIKKGATDYLSPFGQRFIKIDKNKYFITRNGAKNRVISDIEFESINSFDGSKKFKTKQDYINFMSWDISKYTEEKDWEDITPYDLNLSILSDKDINNSVIIVNSQELKTDIYLYANNNKLYMSSSLENEYDEVSNFSMSIMNNNHKLIKNTNPYIGIYTMFKDNLFLRLPLLRITNEKLDLQLRIKYLKKVSEGLYEGCIHKIKNKELACSENKIYILKNPDRCVYGQSAYTCFKQNRLKKYIKNRNVIYESLSEGKETLNEGLVVEKTLTALYRKKLKDIIRRFKYYKQTDTMSILNATNSFYPLKIDLDNNKNEFTKIINSKILNYNKSQYSGASWSYRLSRGLKIKAPLKTLKEERKNIASESLIVTKVALDWLLKYGTVYVVTKPISSNGQDIYTADSYGSIHVTQDMIDKHTDKELELLLIHESMHSIEHITQNAIDKYITLTSELLNNTKNNKPSLFSAIPFSRIGLINTIEDLNITKKLSNSTKERRIDFAVLRFLKSEKDRDLYCNLVSKYGGGTESGRYRSAYTINTAIKTKYFSKLTNDFVIDSIMSNIYHENISLSSPEKFLIDKKRYNERLKDLSKIKNTNNLSNYENIYKFFYYYFFNDAIDAGTNQGIKRLQDKKSKRIKDEYDKMDKLIKIKEK